MKTKIILSLVLLSSLAVAQEVPPANPPSEILQLAFNEASQPQPAAASPVAAKPAPVPTASRQHFAAGEFALDLFGTYTDARPDKLNGSLKGGTYGAGLGATYFFHKNAGLQLDSTVNDVTDANGGLFDHSSVSLIVRYPLGKLAPYAVAGAGWDWNEHQPDTHTGLGVEWRFNQHLGAIGEARWIFGTSGAPDAAQFRAGLRYTF